jgi:hypothetical protein
MNNDRKPTISLAQWCAYLPYELRLKCTEIHDDFFTTLTHWQPTMFINGMNIATAIEYNAKPLLRPMNDDVNVSAVMQVYRSAYDRKDLVWNSKLSLFVSQIDGARLPIYCAPYDIVQAFLAAHYDIFNLIGQGLALPIE